MTWIRALFLTLIAPWIALLAAAVVVVAVLWFWPTDSDPQGDYGFFCDKVDLKPIDGASGWTVSGHTTICNTLGSNVAIYLFVHPAGQGEDRKYLVFRYFEKGGTDLPKIEWTGANELSIRIAQVSQITKMTSSVGPIKISYQVDKEDFPQPK
jgi:hypothetical protein